MHVWLYGRMWRFADAPCRRIPVTTRIVCAPLPAPRSVTRPSPEARICRPRSPRGSVVADPPALEQAAIADAHGDPASCWPWGVSTPRAMSRRSRQVPRRGASSEIRTARRAAHCRPRATLAACAPGREERPPSTWHRPRSAGRGLPAYPTRHPAARWCRARRPIGTAPRARDPMSWQAPSPSERSATCEERESASGGLRPPLSSTTVDPAGAQWLVDPTGR